MFSVSKVEKFRQLDGVFKSTSANKCNGLFNIKRNGKRFTVIVSDAFDWEHVSVSTKKRTPTWNDMCFFKDLFWGTEDCVLQFHPPEKDYINHHWHCLHLWRHAFNEVQLPPIMLV